MNQPSYNNLFQITERGNIQNLNMVIFARPKHLKSWVNAFWYCFNEIKRYMVYYLLKVVPIPEPELFWNISVVSCMEVSKSHDITSLFRCNFLLVSFVTGIR